MSHPLLHRIEYLPPGRLKPAARNPRTHNARQLKKIIASIGRFGFLSPILVSDDLTIIAGHGRLLAALKLGLAEVPCIRLSHLSADERRAYLIADNRLCELGGWSKADLAIELGELLELKFDIEAIGYEPPEVDLLLQAVEEASPASPDKGDELPAKPEASETVCRLGEVWKLGRHLLAIGDAKDPAVMARLMWGQKAAMLFGDPPYNTRITGQASGPPDDLALNQFADPRG